LWQAHFASLRSVKAWVLTLSRLPLLALANLLNLVVVARKKAAVYHFMTEDGLVSALSQAGFGVDRLESGYAAQDWLVVASPVPTTPSPRADAKPALESSN
jgi:hypothetical protein